jgi:hypothetical protein
MDKYKLTRFIDKYHLGGNVNSVVINSVGDILKTRFITGDKQLLGELEMNSWNFQDVELGVYDTEQLSKLLGVLDDDVTIKLKRVGDKAIALEISDQYSTVNFMLSDKSVINQPPPIKKIPEFQLKINVNSKFITRFISGKSALPDTDTFTVITNSSKVNLVIGYAVINTNKVTIPVEVDTYEDIDNVSFNANLFRDVLVANKECETAVLEISQEGLARINFKVDQYDATYYLVAVQDID